MKGSDEAIDSARRIQELQHLLDAARLENQRLHLLLHERPHRSTLAAIARTAIGRVRAAAGARVRSLERTFIGRQERRSAVVSRSAVYAYTATARRPARPTRKRVLHAVANFAVGGSARLIVDLYEHLEHEFEQSAIVRELPSPPAYTGVPVIHEPDVRRPERFVSHLRRVRPDLVHVHFLGHHRTSYSSHDWRWYSSLFQAIDAFGCPVIENVNIPTEPFVNDRVAAYVYVSDYVRRVYGRATGRHLTIYPGSDLEIFSRGADTPVPDNVAGMVYRLERDKLDERSIEVFLKVVKERPATTALIIGGGGLQAHYERAVRAQGLEDAVRFTGYVSYRELPALLREISVFVAPVHCESFGQVSVFAMGMELPVAGFNVGALPEIIGDTACLAPASDYDALARIVVNLLDDRERRIRVGVANAKRARERFSLEAMIRAYEGLYREILE